MVDTPSEKRPRRCLSLSDLKKNKQLRQVFDGVVVKEKGKGNSFDSDEGGATEDMQSGGVAVSYPKSATTTVLSGSDVTILEPNSVIADSHDVTMILRVDHETKINESSLSTTEQWISTTPIEIGAAESFSIMSFDPVPVPSIIPNTTTGTYSPPSQPTTIDVNLGLENDDEAIPLNELADADSTTIVMFRRSMYLEAFENIIDTVLDGGEGFLFTADELAVFAVYRRLDDDARLLFIRLFMRKTASARWFRLARLDYPQIHDLHAAARRLCEDGVGFAEDEGEMSSMDKALEMLSVEEMKEVARGLCREVERVGGKNRTQLVEAIKRSVREQPTLRTDLKQRTLSFTDYTTRHNRESSVIKSILAKTGMIRLPLSF
ncbi:hypothetical protein BC936DRAFT_143490 [Jimgerdemannia flammicorona]|uniref:Fanconi-associated nuclease n=1 Tax=Jimgerdemannia flammicorona TaxID=994334 RepID=A0A432ZYS8_9FUNG|nr:hypothetical protein BC936DRAFT_143490 [Jimgerdemannia flammicorona]